MSPSSTFDFPAGTYLGINGELRLGRGGQTRVILMRQRALLELAGIDMPIVTIDAYPEYEAVRSGFVDQGLMAPQSRILNLFDWFAEGGADDWHAVEDVSDRDDRLLSRCETVSTTRKDGRPWRIAHRDADGTVMARDYLRDDGTLALRCVTPAGSAAGLSGKSRAFDREGAAVLEVPHRTDLIRRWIQAITPGDEQVFLVSDSRFAIYHLVDLGERFHTLHQMHAPHIKAERFWHSSVNKTYETLMEFQQRLDGLLSLSERQRRDIALRYGLTDNLFVVPNPIDMPQPPPEPVPRSARRVVTMARLTPQKRLDRAVRAFAALLETVPDATFDIYGQGRSAANLQALIDKLGVGHAVTLRGYDPQARESLWSATCYWMTSGYEGYPLAVLEAMSHGCPPVCFDIKYGPREQIVDGVNGFLVDDGDLDALVQQTCVLMEDEDRRAAMGRAGVVTAREHTFAEWMHQIAWICREVVDRKGRRTTIDRLGVRGCRVSLRRLLEASDGSASAAIRGHLRVKGSGSRPFDDDEVDVRLQMWATESDGIADLPVRMQIRGRTVRVYAEITADHVREALVHLGVTGGEARLRLCLTWGNSARVHDVASGVIVIDPPGTTDSRLSLQWRRTPPAVRLRHSLHGIYLRALPFAVRVKHRFKALRHP